jgi:hypothetical protein
MDGLGCAAGHICKEELENGVVAASAGLHDGVTALVISAEYAGAIVFAYQVDDFGVASFGGEQEGALVELVQRGAGFLVASFYQDLADVAIAQGGGEMQVRVGQALGGGVWVVDEVRMGFEHALDEQGIVGVDGSPEPDWARDRSAEERQRAFRSREPTGRFMLHGECGVRKPPMKSAGRMKGQAVESRMDC